MEKISRLWTIREIFYSVYLVRGDKLCDQFKDASVIRTIARHRVTFTKIFYAHHWKDTPEPKRTQQ